MVSPLPASVSSVIQLLLFQGVSSNGAVEYLSREEVFSTIKCMMYRYFGEVVSIRFTPTVSKTIMILNVKEIRTPSMVLKVEGFIEINPFTRSIYSELSVLENREEQIDVRIVVEDGYVVPISENEYEVRYYV
ncbi:MAG: hypothetical protein QXJ97_01340 [Desulfurococcaceae archaeon]